MYANGSHLPPRPAACSSSSWLQPAVSEGAAHDLGHARPNYWNLYGYEYDLGHPPRRIPRHTRSFLAGIGHSDYFFCFGDPFWLFIPTFAARVDLSCSNCA